MRVRMLAAGNQRQNTSAGSGTASRAARATTWLLPHSAAVEISASVPSKDDRVFIRVLPSSAFDGWLVARALRHMPGQQQALGIVDQEEQHRADQAQQQQ